MIVSDAPLRKKYAVENKDLQIFNFAISVVLVTGDVVTINGDDVSNH